MADLDADDDEGEGEGDEGAPEEVSAYGPESIVVLKGLDVVRRRPGMYIGDTGPAGLLWGIIGNVIDQHLIGAATAVELRVAEDGWLSVHDDGPGIPVEPFPGGELSVLEIVMTTIGNQAAFHAHLPRMHGLPLAIVNALSSDLEVETVRDGVRWTQRYEAQKPTTAPRALGPASVEGTTIRFRPDPAIFGQTRVDTVQLGSRLQELAWLSPMLRVSFQGRRLRGTGGVHAWVTSLGVTTAFSSRYCAGGVSVDLTIGWRSDGGEASIRSFVNLEPTNAGTHHRGMWIGLSRALKRYEPIVREFGAVCEALAPGLVAVLHVGLHNPRFDSPQRDQLLSPIAALAVRRSIVADLPDALWRDLSLRTLLCERLGIEPDQRWMP